MPWGKNKGDDIEDLDSSYIVYCLENFDLKPDLRGAMEREMHDRYSLHKSAYHNEKIDDKKVKDVYRKLSLKYHPDKGGNNMAMAAVNEFKELLFK